MGLRRTIVSLGKKISNKAHTDRSKSHQCPSCFAINLSTFYKNQWKRNLMAFFRLLLPEWAIIKRTNSYARKNFFNPQKGRPQVVQFDSGLPTAPLGFPFKTLRQIHVGYHLQHWHQNSWSAGIGNRSTYVAWNIEIGSQNVYNVIFS